MLNFHVTKITFLEVSLSKFLDIDSDSDESLVTTREVTAVAGEVEDAPLMSECGLGLLLRQLIVQLKTSFYPLHNNWSFYHQNRNIPQEMFLLLFFIVHVTIIHSQICKKRELESRPVHISYLENVRKTVSYPCCQNIVCKPPLCKKVQNFRK